MNSLVTGSDSTHTSPPIAPHKSARRIRSQEDELRFGRVVLPHLADAYALARGLTGSRTDAQDVVQEASIRALRSIRTFGNGNARAWVLTIVRNTAYDWLHKNRQTELVFVDHVEDIEGTLSSEADAATPESALIQIDDDAVLVASISALPAHLRDTLWLRDVHGLTYREVAEQLGVSIGTVMSRLFRARRRLIASTLAHRRWRPAGEAEEILSRLPA